MHRFRIETGPASGVKENRIDLFALIVSDRRGQDFLGKFETGWLWRLRFGVRYTVA